MEWFYRNGKLKAQGIFRKGHREGGPWETYNQKGNLKSKGYYKNDKKEGSWDKYDSDGELLERRHFINGEEVE